MFTNFLFCLTSTLQLVCVVDLAPPVGVVNLSTPVLWPHQLVWCIWIFVSFCWFINNSANFNKRNAGNLWTNLVRP